MTEEICGPLTAEDAQIQSMPDASPPKWHLGHTSWFFETTVLKAFLKSHRPFEPRYEYLFNSYYEGLGERQPRHERGLLSRPSLSEILQYRRWVNDRVLELLARSENPVISAAVKLAIEHERQHQELLLTDIKHIFWKNPLRPSYRNRLEQEGERAVRALEYISFAEGLHSVGHEGSGFAFDNEMPAHRIFLEPFELGSRLVTNGEYLEFIEEGGYHRPELWLSDGWDAVLKNGWNAPLYWERDERSWSVFTLSGQRRLELDQPVCHLSLYEADAYARFRKARLPSEMEWEVAARLAAAPLAEANLLEKLRYHTCRVAGARSSGALDQCFGDVWEWTSSAYAPYPGFQPFPGVLAEYNGKFMCNQMVLRGGSFGTSREQIRLTYRNFFQPTARWQFAGVRLARSIP